MRRSSPERPSGGPTPAPGVGLLACALVCAAACGGGGGGLRETDDDAGSSGSSGATTEGPPGSDEQTPTGTCETAPRAVQGRYSGTLRGDQLLPKTGGVCGGGGPDQFLRVMVPARADLRIEARGAGFVPRVGLAPADCLETPLLACSADGIVRLDDVAGGTELMLTIGADPGVYAALLEQHDEDAPDPLGFVVDVGMTPVLAADEVCVPQVLGRCAAGTLCMPPQVEDDGWRCTALEGDSCADPQRVSVVLEDGRGTLTIDPDLPQSDAHRHSCTGGGTRERVLRLRLPAGLRPLQDSLQIRSGRPEVGLAVRAPGCLGSDELDCGAPGVGGAQVTIEAPGELYAAGVEPYLFVELPEPGVLGEEVVLQVRVVLRAPPTKAP